MEVASNVCLPLSVQQIENHRARAKTAPLIGSAIEPIFRERPKKLSQRIGPKNRPANRALP